MKKNRFLSGLMLAAFMLAVVAGGYLVWNFFFKPDPVATRAILQDTAQPLHAADKKKQTVYLYFSDEKNMHLVSEDRVLFAAEDPIGIGRKIIGNLIEGPKENLVRTIPVGTKLNAMYLSNGGTAYLDFSDTIQDQHPGGSRTELLTVFSIVNSIVLNIPQVRDVKILIEGRETLTLSGHIDLTAPLTANMILIR